MFDSGKPFNVFCASKAESALFTRASFHPTTLAQSIRAIHTSPVAYHIAEWTICVKSCGSKLHLEVFLYR